ncbi:hypothetical protein ACP3V3_02170 [Vibrio sp. PNB22_3_1]
MSNQLEDLFNVVGEFTSVDLMNFDSQELAVKDTSYVFEVANLARVVEYISAPVAGGVLLLEGERRTGKSTMPSQVAARLGVRCRMLDANHPDFTVEGMFDYPTAVEAEESRLVTHVDNVDVLSEGELKTLIDGFSMLQHGGDRLVLSAGGAASISAFGIRSVYLDYPSPLALKARLENLVEQYGFKGMQLSQAQSLVSTMVEICGDLKSSSMTHEVVGVWFAEAITLLKFGLCGVDFFFESIDSLGSMLFEDELQELRSVAHRVVGTKLSAAKQAKSQSQVA